MLSLPVHSRTDDVESWHRHWAAGRNGACTPKFTEQREDTLVLNNKKRIVSVQVTFASRICQILLFPHTSPISRTRGHRRRLPFPYHRYIQKKTQTKEEREEKNNRRENLPRSDRRGRVCQMYLVHKVRVEY